MVKKSKDASDEFTVNLIKQLNKENGENIAFNLSTDEAPTNIKRWISTGSKQLDAIIGNRLYAGLPEGRIIEIQGPASCHAAGDKVVLYNGKTINVEDVKIGDRLLGPDGESRMVLECHNGQGEKMYKIHTRRGGKTYTVTENHILNLKRSAYYTKNKNSPKSKFGDVVNISVKDYIQKSKTFKKMYMHHCAEIKSFKGVKQHKLKIPPYILGLLLGDGSMRKSRIELTTADEEIEKSFVEYIKECGFVPKYHYKRSNKAKGIYYATNMPSNQFLHEERKDLNTIRQALECYDLIGKKSGNKFIPQEYKTSSYENRLELIAGLIDTDGHANKTGFDYVTKSKQLAEDMSFVCNSVGLRTRMKSKINKRYNIVYYRLNITGDIAKIPTKVYRKKVKKYSSSSRCIDNVYLTGFKLEEVTPEPFFGFTVDKDNLYLTDDFSIFHNSGKSHIAFEAAKSTQSQGGIVVYIDTENATSLNNLQQIGIDVKNRFVFCQTACTEEIFAIAESTILKTRAMKKDVPVTIIWDSVAASSPKAELEGSYDQNTIGLQARTLGKGMRKIANIIGNQNVTFLLINQQRQKIGVLFGDPTTTPGGMAIPYASSVRIKISSTGQTTIKDKKSGDTVGIKVKAKTIKNKVARPFRECEFEIHFGVGIVEHEQVFDLFRTHCDELKKAKNLDGVRYKKDIISVTGSGAWKYFTVSDASTGEVKIEEKFYKADFKKILENPEYKKYVDAIFDSALVVKPDQDIDDIANAKVDTDSIEEVNALKASR